MKKNINEQIKKRFKKWSSSPHSFEPAAITSTLSTCYLWSLLDFALVLSKSGHMVCWSLVFREVPSCKSLPVAVPGWPLASCLKLGRAPFIFSASTEQKIQTGHWNTLVSSSIFVNLHCRVTFGSDFLKHLRNSPLHSEVNAFLW